MSPPPPPHHAQPQAFVLPQLPLEAQRRRAPSARPPQVPMASMQPLSARVLERAQQQQQQRLWKQRFRKAPLEAPWEQWAQSTRVKRICTRQRKRVWLLVSALQMKSMWVV